MAGAICQPIIRKLVDELFKWTSAPLRYIWNYKTSFKNLETELGELQRTKREIEISVDEAESDGMEIEEHVKNWLDQANKMIDEVTKVVEENKKDGMKCFNNLFPDLRKRYRLSKNAADKTKDVSELRVKELAPISHRRILLGSRHISNEFNEDFQSRMIALNLVITALKHVNMVGIYGLGGVGKTTLAKKVGQRVKEMKLFDSVVFVEVTEEPNAERIRGRIADMLNLKLHKEDPSARADELYEMLENKSKLLIILDNIFEKIDLKEIGIPLADGDKGCRFLLTARRRDVCMHMDCGRDFPLDVLDKKDSWVLFAKTAGSCVEDGDIQSIARDVADRCGGLPVAIVTIAKALRDKPASYWRNASDQIRQYPEDAMEVAYSCIQWSYNHLKSDIHRSTFLLCSIMASISDASVENVLRYGLTLNMFQRWEKIESYRDNVCALLEDLKNGSLLLEASDDKIFSIHDVVGEVGTRIIGAEKGYHIFSGTQQLLQWDPLENLTWIFLIDITNELPIQLNCPKLTFCYLQTKSETWLSMSLGFFYGMPNLEIVNIEGLDLLELPESLLTLRKLQALYLKRCDLGDISSIGNIKSLEILVMCKIRSKEIELPDSIGNLSELKLLDLRSSSFIIAPGIISKLTRLEELYVEESTSLEVEEFKNLCRLTALHARFPDAAIEFLSKSTVFGSLLRYNLVIGDRGIHWPLPGSSRALQIVYSKLTSLGMIDINIGSSQLACLAQNLTEMDIYGCQNLKHLFSSSALSRVKHLERLMIYSCRALEVLVRIDNDNTMCIEFPSLKQLQIGNCQELRELIGRRCRVEGEILEGSTKTFSFPQLSILCLESLSDFRCFYNGEYNMECPKLERMRVLDCRRAVDLLDFQKHDTIDLAQQRPSSSVHQAFPQWEKLELTVQPSQLGMIRWSSFLECQHFFPRLRCLHVVTRIGTGIRERMLPLGIIEKFHFLEELEVEGCTNEEIFSCEDVGENAGDFSLLKKLYLCNLPQLKEIWKPGCKIDLPKLEFLEVRRCPALSFRNLRILNVENCGEMISLVSASTVQCLTALEELSIVDCGMMKQIIENEGDVEGVISMPRLNTLNLQMLNNLTSFYSGNCTLDFPLLEDIFLLECPNFISFSPGAFTMQNLQEVYCNSRTLMCKDDELNGLLRREMVSLILNQSSLRDNNLKWVPTLFSEHIQDFHKVEELRLNGNLEVEMWQSQISKHKFPQLKFIGVASDNSTAFPVKIFERLHNSEKLETLAVDSCGYTEILMVPPQIKHLYLIGLLNLKQTWKMDFNSNLLQNLESLEVLWCPNLIDVFPLSSSSSFSNLKIITVHDCSRLMSLMDASIVEGLVHLEEMRINECKKMRQIVQDSEMEMEMGVEDKEVTFKMLKKLQLENLTSLRSFLSGNYSLDFPNLGTLNIENCPALEKFCSRNLKTKMLRQITQEGENYACNDDLNEIVGQPRKSKVSFLLNVSILSNDSLQLVQNLFPECIQDFPKVDELRLLGNFEVEIWQSQISRHKFPQLKSIFVACDISTVFPDKIFERLHNSDKLETLVVNYCGYTEILMVPPQIKHLNLKHLFNMKQIWKRDFNSNLLQNLESLEVGWCDNLVNVLPASSSSFSNLKIIKVMGCNRLMGLMDASTAEGLPHLEEMLISGCKMMRQIVEDSEMEMGVEDKEITFQKLKKLELESLISLRSFFFGNCSLDFPNLETLNIKKCPALDIFCSRNLKTKTLRQVSQDEENYNCNNDLNEIVGRHHKLKILLREKLCFNNMLQNTTQVAATNHPVFSNLTQLVCWGDDISSLHQSQQVFAIADLRQLLIFQNKSAPSFPLAILHRYQSVEEVELKCSSYEAIFSYGDIQKHAKAYARLKRLFLYELDNLKEIWKQDVSRLDPILQNSIRTLEVESCSSLISLMPPSSCFQYLTELRIVDCDHLMNLFDSATAESLAQLTELYIRNCKVMKEVISNGEARDVHITFNKLESLDLHDLPDLTSFCLGNCIFMFPCLSILYLRKCPKMKFFSAGVLHTPKLNKIHHDGKEFMCVDDLNNTIHAIQEKQNARTSPQDSASPSAPFSFYPEDCTGPSV